MSADVLRPTLAAFCSLSPDSPTAMFRTSLEMRIARISWVFFLSACARRRHFLQNAAPNCETPLYMYKNAPFLLPPPSKVWVGERAS